MCHIVRMKKNKIASPSSFLASLGLRHRLLPLTSYLLLLTSYLIPHPSLAQQESLRMMYPNMPLSINPARAGASKVASVTGFYRKKPLFTVPGMSSFSQQYLSFDMPINDENLGIGFLGFNGNTYGTSGGIASNLGLAVVVSKRVWNSDDRELFVGANIGTNQIPVITSSGNTDLQGSYGVGLYYQTPIFQVGISRPSAYFGTSSTVPIYGQVQLLKEIGDGVLRVGSVLRYLSLGAYSDYKADVYAIYWVRQTVGFGIWSQNTGAEMGNPALLGLVQIGLSKNFMLTYGYDFLGKSLTSTSGSLGSSSSSTQNDSGSGFHQIGIRYDIDLGNGKSNGFRP